MASQVVDSLVVATEFDSTGLDRSVQASLAQIDRFVQRVDAISRDLPEISLDTSQVQQALADAGGDLDRFAEILAQLTPEQFAEALDVMVTELEAAQEQFGATSVESERLQAAVASLTTTGSRLAQSTGGAVTALQEQATAAGVASAGVEASVQQLNEFVKRVDAVSRDLPEIGIDASAVEQELSEASGNVDDFVGLLSKLSPEQFVAALNEITTSLQKSALAFREGADGGQAFDAAIDSLRETSSRVASSTKDSTESLDDLARAAGHAEVATGGLTGELSQLGPSALTTDKAIKELGQDLLLMGREPTVLTLDSRQVVDSATAATTALEKTAGVDLTGLSRSLQRFGAITAQVSGEIRQFGLQVHDEVLIRVRQDFTDLARLISQLPKVGDMGAEEAARRIQEIVEALKRVESRLKGTAIINLAQQVRQQAEQAQAELARLGNTTVNFAKVTLPPPDTKQFVAALNRAMNVSFTAANDEMMKRALDPSRFKGQLDALATGVRAMLERAGGDTALLQNLLGGLFAHFPDQLDAALRQALAEVGVIEIPAQITVERQGLADVEAESSQVATALDAQTTSTDNLAASQVTATQTSAQLAAALSIPPGADRQIERIGAAIGSVSSATTQASAKVTGMIAALSEIGRVRLTDQVTGPMSVAGREAAKAAKQTEVLGDAFNFSTSQANKLRSGLTALAVQAAGTTGPVGQLAQSILLFGGTGVVAGVAATVAILAAGYRFLTTATREAREEQDRLVQSLLQAANQAMPAMIKTQLALTAAVESEARARTALERIRRAQAIIATGIPGAAPAADLITEELARRQLQNIENVQRAQRQAHLEQKKNLREFETASARALTESISLNQANAQEIQRAAEQVEVLLFLEQDTTLTLAEQLEIYRTRVGLQKALASDARRMLDFWKAFRDAENQIRDAQVQLVRLGFGDPTDLVVALKEARKVLDDINSDDEQRLAAANRLNAVAAAMVAPLEEQAAATAKTADNILAAAKEAGRLEGLESVLGLTANSTGLDAAIAKAEKELADLKRQGAELPVDADVGPLLRAIEEVERRIARLREQRGLVDIVGDVDAGPLQQQIAEIDATLTRMRNAGLQTTDAFKQLAQTKLGLEEKLKEATKLADELGRIAEQPLELQFKVKLDLKDPDKAMADLLKELQQRSDEHVFDFAIKLKEVNIPVDIDQGAQGEAERAFDALDSSLLNQSATWRIINRRADEYLAKLRDSRTAAERMGDSLLQAADIMRGLGDVLGQLEAQGLIRLNDSDRRAIASFTGLVETAGRFASGDIAGGILSGLSTLGSMFGKSRFQQELERTLAENTRAIRANTIARTTGFEGLGGAIDAASIIERALATRAGQLLDTGLGRSGRDIGREVRQNFIDQLESMGLTFKQLQRIADEFGIDILVSGRVSAEALRQLAEEAKAAAEAAFRFNQGLFEDEQTLERMRSRALGREAPEQIFRDNLKAAADAGAEVFEEFFGDIDLGDPDAIRKASLDLIEAWENNLIDIEDLGGLTREQWLEIIESGLDAADAIDAMTESFNELSIVPRGFRAAALAFEAMDPAVMMQPVFDRMVNAVDQATLDAAPFGTDGAELPVLVSQGESTVQLLTRIAETLEADIGVRVAGNRAQDVVAHLVDALGKAKVGTSVMGDIIIQVQTAAETNQETALDIRRAFEDIAMSDRGNTRDWGRT